MRNFLDFGTLMALSIIFTSCSVGLNVQGSRVKVISDSQSKNCESIAHVIATYELAATMGGNLESATNEARNKAGNLGADSILIQSSNYDAISGASVSGIAFKCSK